MKMLEIVGHHGGTVEVSASNGNPGRFSSSGVQTRACRFFFNFGVHHARQILLREHFQVQPGQAGAAGAAQQQGAALGLLAGQELLFQHALLKDKPVGTPLPGSTSAVTDPRSAFQLPRELTSIPISGLQNQMHQVSLKPPTILHTL